MSLPRSIVTVTTPGNSMSSYGVLSERLASAGPVACNLTGKRSYDREVGTCHLADGRDIGNLLISEGVCSRWQ